MICFSEEPFYENLLQRGPFLREFASERILILMKICFREDPFMGKCFREDPFLWEFASERILLWEFAAERIRLWEIASERILFLWQFALERICFVNLLQKGSFFMRICFGEDPFMGNCFREDPFFYENLLRRGSFLWICFRKDTFHDKLLPTGSFSLGVASKKILLWQFLFVFFLDPSEKILSMGICFL